MTTMNTLWEAAAHSYFCIFLHSFETCKSVQEDAKMCERAQTTLHGFACFCIYEISFNNVPQARSQQQLRENLLNNNVAGYFSRTPTQPKQHTFTARTGFMRG
jgi:hypothetical protein